MVDIPGERRSIALPLSTSRNTTLSVLTGDYEAVVSVTTNGDVLFRINFHGGYRILEQTRLLVNFTDKMSLKSTSVISEPFVNRSSIVIEVACSRVPYSYFQVQVALQVGDEVGPFVSDGKTHEINDNTNTYIIVGSVAGSVVLIVLLILVISIIIMCCCYWKGKTRQKEIERQKDTAFKKLENEKAEIERQKDTALKKLENEKAEIEQQKDTALKKLENEKAEIERQKDTALKKLENEKAEIEQQKDTALKKLENEKAEIEQQKDTALINLEIEKGKTEVKKLEELRKIGGPKLFEMETEKLKQYLNAISDFISHTAEANQPNRVVSDGDETSEKDRETKRQIVANFLKDVHTHVQIHTVSKLHTMS